MSQIIRSKTANSPTFPTLHDYTDADIRKGLGLGLRNKPPVGFWYQINGEWERWCASEMPSWLTEYRHVIEVDLRYFCILDSPKKMHEFYDKYALRAARVAQGRVSSSLASLLDWKRIMDDFDGIEMPNYQHHWSFSFTVENPNDENEEPADAGWTYGWDVASGVCWRPVKCIRFIKCESRIQRCRILLDD